MHEHAMHHRRAGVIATEHKMGTEAFILVKSSVFIDAAQFFIARLDLGAFFSELTSINPLWMEGKLNL